MTTDSIEVDGKDIEYHRINNDVNGNPRYVVHFLAILSSGEMADDIHTSYLKAIKKIHSIGGRKFHNKSFGGGLVFQSYNIADSLRHAIQA